MSSGAISPWRWSMDWTWCGPTRAAELLYDDEQWRVFEQLYSIYRQHAEEDVPPPEETAIPGVMGPARHPTVQVLLDEESQFLTRPGSTLDMLLSANRDAILQSGVSAEFYLLDNLSMTKSRARRCISSLTPTG